MRTPDILVRALLPGKKAPSVSTQQISYTLEGKGLKKDCMGKNLVKVVAYVG